MVALMPSVLKRKTANEKADEFIGFIKKHFLRHVPQVKPDILGDYRRLESEMDYLAEEISADKQLAIAQAYKNAGRQIAKPETIEKWEKRAANKARAAETLAALFSKASVTENLLTQEDVFTQCKLVSAKEKDAHLYFTPGETDITEKQLAQFVISPLTGTIYLRENIEKWINDYGTDPVLNNRHLSVDQLIAVSKENVDLALLNQRLNLQALQKGIETVKETVKVEIEPQLKEASIEDKQAVSTLKTRLDNQGRKVERLIHAPDLPANTYSETAKETLSMVKKSKLPKTVENSRSTLLNILESAINFFLVNWLSKKPFYFFRPAANEVEKMSNDHKENHSKTLDKPNFK